MRTSLGKVLLVGLLAMAVTTSSGCELLQMLFQGPPGPEGPQGPPGPPGPGGIPQPIKTMFCITGRVAGEQRLIKFDVAFPVVIEDVGPITGDADTNGAVLGCMDQRCPQGTFFAVGDDNRIYQVDVTDGSTTQVNPTPFAPALNDNTYAGEFYPNDLLFRVIDFDSKSTLVNPDTGQSLQQANTAYVAGDPNDGLDNDPNHVASDANGNFFVIDDQQDVLASFGGGNGELQTIGALGIALFDVLNPGDGEGGCFDICKDSGEAYAVLTPDFTGLVIPQGAFQALYHINLNNGEATLIGLVGDGLRDVNAGCLDQNSAP